MKHFMLKTILLVSYFITFNAIGNNNEYILTTCSVNNNILKIISTKIKNQNFYTFELAGGDYHSMPKQLQDSLEFIFAENLNEFKRVQFLGNEEGEIKSIIFYLSNTSTKVTIANRSIYLNDNNNDSLLGYCD